MLRDHQLANEEGTALEDCPFALFSTFDLFPCAMIFWSARYSACVLNMEARRLTGFSTSDLQHTPSLWVSRIHARDRALFSATRERLQGGEKKVQCDYRFFPKGGTEVLWLRETASLFLSPQGEVEGVISVYTEISDLKKRCRTKGRELAKAASEEGIIEEFVHAAQNNLQGISMGLDLLRINHGDSFESDTIFRGVERSSRLLREIREYFTPPEPRLSTEDLEGVVEEVVRKVEKKWGQRERRLQVVYSGASQLLRLDWRQLRNAFERVLDFSLAVSPGEQEIKIAVGLQEIAFQRYIELKITIPDAASIDEKEIFRPFLRVNGYEVGLSLMLVHNMLQRQNGDIAFHKGAQQEGLCTIRLKAH
jgi:hypothetical protein